MYTLKKGKFFGINYLCISNLQHSKKYIIKYAHRTFGSHLFRKK